MVSFIQCGILGWSLEIFWTGLMSLLQGDRRLTGRSSLWMFPIYGLAALICPAYQLLKPLHICFRGLIYMICIFAVEYLSGTILRFFQICPWDYSSCTFQLHGLIRLDYAPLWFFTGLLFEWFLCHP